MLASTFLEWVLTFVGFFSSQTPSWLPGVDRTKTRKITASFCTQLHRKRFIIRGERSIWSQRLGPKTHIFLQKGVDSRPAKTEQRTHLDKRNKQKKTQLCCKLNSSRERRNWKRSVSEQSKKPRVWMKIVYTLMAIKSSGVDLPEWVARLSTNTAQYHHNWKEMSRGYLTGRELWKIGVGVRKLKKTWKRHEKSSFCDRSHPQVEKTILLLFSFFWVSNPERLMLKIVLLLAGWDSQEAFLEWRKIDKKHEKTDFYSFFHHRTCVFQRHSQKKQKSENTFRIDSYS